VMHGRSASRPCDVGWRSVDGLFSAQSQQVDSTRAWIDFTTSVNATSLA
jgi:hypothetical protein